MTTVQITAQKLRESDGEVISEQHLFIVGEEHDLQRDEVLMAIDFAEQNCAAVGRKLYTCPKMLIEIMDVMRDKCSGRIQMERSSEDLPFASEMSGEIGDHYVLTLDSKDMFTSVEVNGEEVVDDELPPATSLRSPTDSSTPSLFREEGHPSECVCSACTELRERHRVRAANATMWASGAGSPSTTWRRDNTTEERDASPSLPQPAGDGVRPQFEEGK